MFSRSCKQNCDETSRQPPASLYVHVPFCAAKCRYCDFYSVPLAGEQARWLAAVGRELDMRCDWPHLPLATLFFGGGTPTVLGHNHLSQLLAIFAPLMDHHTETSVESNPGTFDQATAATLTGAGVGRLNFGVQSFCDSHLRTLGRIHTAPKQKRPSAWGEAPDSRRSAWT